MRGVDTSLRLGRGLERRKYNTINECTLTPSGMHSIILIMYEVTFVTRHNASSLKIWGDEARVLYTMTSCHRPYGFLPQDVESIYGHTQSNCTHALMLHIVAISVVYTYL